MDFSLHSFLKYIEDNYSNKKCISWCNNSVVIDKTYCELISDIRKVADCLLKYHINGSKVCLIGDNSYDWIVANFAILFLGGKLIPLPNDSNKEFLNYVFSYCSCELLVSCDLI